MNTMTKSPYGSIIYYPTSMGKTSTIIQDYIKMCNIENKQNTQIHIKGKIKNFQKNINLRKYHYIHQPGRTNCTQRYQK